MQTEIRDRLLSLIPATEVGSTPHLAQFYTLLREYSQYNKESLASEILLTSARLHGIEKDNGLWDSVLWLAAAIEILQSWKTIHEDIEDNTKQRYGAPTLHQVYGMSIAANLGDDLHIYMWSALSNVGLPAANNEFLKIVQYTTEGQHILLERSKGFESEHHLLLRLRILALKDGYHRYIAPLRLGAIASGQSPHPLLTAAGEKLSFAEKALSSLKNLSDICSLDGKLPKEGKEPVFSLLALSKMIRQECYMEECDNEIMNKDRFSNNWEGAYEINEIADTINMEAIREYAQKNLIDAMSMLEEAFYKESGRDYLKILERRISKHLLIYRS